MLHRPTPTGPTLIRKPRTAAAMKLSKEQIKQALIVILSGYDVLTLRRMVREEFGEVTVAIARGSSLHEISFNLIR